MRRLMTLIAALAAPLPAMADDGTDRAGVFDYFVLAVSWQPSWCAATGDARDAPECRPGTGRGFSVHGLWPQYERGWPEYCDTAERDPARHDSQSMADIMGSGGLAWYQWQKHGRCSGLSAAAYYGATRAAFDGLTVPPVLAGLDRDITLPPDVVEQAFLEANPGLSPDGVTIECRDGALTEIRVCLTRDLSPRDCAPDTRRDCGTDRVLMEAPR